MGNEGRKNGAGLPPVYEVEGLRFAYGETSVFGGLGLSIPEGEVVSFLGGNGCGKTTLFRLMTKGLKPDGGRVLLRGEDVAHVALRDFSRQVAIVHQHNACPHDLTVRALVAYGRTPHRGYFDPVSLEDEAAVDRALAITDLTDYEDRAMGSLSGGQRQRAFIAMSIAQETEILFMDEPTTFLDIRYQAQILELVRRLNRERGTTIVMVLHDINQAMHYSDSVLAFSPKGELLAQGSPQTVVTEALLESVYGVRLRLFQAEGQTLAGFMQKE
ncbi:MAG: ABC transporter ATP-binding protein [Clostridiales Family XIII bacterium]|jgi:iron complex transport system ATP-binding protein|nr:ABC transporter ATP-binding protein [Clostridiales Family XIII bacterium]